MSKTEHATHPFTRQIVKGKFRLLAPLMHTWTCRWMQMLSETAGFLFFFQIIFTAEYTVSVEWCAREHSKAWLNAAAGGRTITWFMLACFAVLKHPHSAIMMSSSITVERVFQYPPITYYWTVPLILDHSYFVRKSTSSKIADTKVSGFYKFLSFCFSNFWICQVPNEIWVVQY
jgi:hypothetical protein